MRISIIVAAHNEGTLLARTIESIYETSGNLDHELIISDDASDDGSIEDAKQHFTQVRFVRHEHRLGASPTKDLGARAAEGDVLVFLDGHTLPESGAIARLTQSVALLQAQAVVTPAIAALDTERWINRTDQVGNGYGLDLRTHDCSWLSLDRMRQVRERGRTFYESPAAIGCAFAVGRNLYHRLLGFDRHMRAWGVEDLDFSLRCWLLGHRILHDPEATIGHRFRESFDNYSVPAGQVVANHLRMARKHYTMSVWQAWTAMARERYATELPGHPEGLWARAWELFVADRASAEADARLIAARRVHDEFWYAGRFGLDWPRLGPTGEAGRFVSLAASPTPSGGPSGGPSTAPCTIRSQTVATIPGNRARTTIGVGEPATLTFSGTNANWTLAGPGKLSATTGKTIRYTATHLAGSATITAQDTASGCRATIRFTVIAPNGIVDRTVAGGTVQHTHDRPDIGFRVNMFLRPDSVSFQFLQVKELDAHAVATGVYAPFNGIGHGPNPNPVVVGAVVPGLGSKVQAVDHVYSGDPGTAPPFAPGSITFHIPNQYQLQSGGPLITFTTTTQVCSLAADLQTLTASKAGASVTTQVAAPTSP